MDLRASHQRKELGGRSGGIDVEQLAKRAIGVDRHPLGGGHQHAFGHAGEDLVELAALDLYRRDVLRGAHGQAVEGARKPVELVIEIGGCASGTVAVSTAAAPGAALGQQLGGVDATGEARGESAALHCPLPRARRSRPERVRDRERRDQPGAPVPPRLGEHAAWWLAVVSGIVQGTDGGWSARVTDVLRFEIEDHVLGDVGGVVRDALEVARREQ